MESAKKSAQQLLDRLPDDAGWDDIMYGLHVKRKVERGQQAVTEGRTVPHTEIRSLLV